MKYKIYRRKKRLKVQVKYAKKPPYMFNPGYRKNKNIVDVDQIRVYNPYMINNLLLKRFVRKYKEILKMSYIIFNDENPSDSSFSVVLGEIDRLRSKLLNKYIKYMSTHKFDNCMKKIDFIEKEIFRKYFYNNTNILDFEKESQSR